jgi:hypothetical protein
MTCFAAGATTPMNNRTTFLAAATYGFINTPNKPMKHYLTSSYSYFFGGCVKTIDFRIFAT